MKTEIKVPSAGESITSGVIASWEKANGDYVNEGDIICELETDKAAMEVPATVSGVLEILVEEETEVEIGQVIGTISSEVERPAEQVQPDQQHPAPEPAEPTPEKVSAPEPAPEPETVTPDVEVAQKDVMEEPSGPKRIPAGQVASSAPPTPVRKPPQPQRRTERIPMSNIRRKTANRLVHAQQTAAYLTTFNEIDMQKVIDIRAQYKETFEREHGIRIGFMSFFVKACCQALKQYPGVNSMLEGNDLIYQYFYDIGVAVSVEQGLLVPIIRDADRLHFAEIEIAIEDRVTRAKNKKLKVEELTGGTFTITNGGVFGSMLSTPIPAYPQTAILGMHAIRKRPIVVEDQIVIRPVMYVALSYDHRVVDGKDAIGFLMAVKNYIEEPDKLLLQL